MREPRESNGAAAVPEAKPPSESDLMDLWEGKWEEALSLWSRYVKLSHPRFCFTQAEEKEEGLSSSFAMIRLNDHAVVISLRQVKQYGLENYPVEVMAHEIGHHVYCPADLTDQARMIARIQRMLPGKETYTGIIQNLYADLLINNRLYRENNLRMADIYKKLADPSASKLWNFYMRIYEILWALPSGTLAPKLPDVMEGDALLGNTVIRNFSRDWVRGAGRFAALCFPYIESETGGETSWLKKLYDCEQAAGGEEFPIGMTEMDEGELADCVHPADELGKKPPDPQSGGQRTDRSPHQFGQIMAAMGLKLSEDEIAYRYYKEKALPHLIPFPVKKSPAGKEPQMEGTEVWDIGSPIEEISWVDTAIRSPVVIPGYTTLETVYGEVPGPEPSKEPIDLDLYVDCSGSMPDPRQDLSYLTLAGAIMALSALRSGARVHATLWSGPGEHKSTDGFVRDEKEILKILTGYFGDGTQFPLDVLKKTYDAPAAGRRKTHIMIISDDGVTTIFGSMVGIPDGYDVTARAFAAAGAGGSMVLNYASWALNAEMKRAEKMGFQIAAVSDWAALTAFAREFSRRQYGNQ